MGGWIKLHRKMQEHWLYTEKRVFSKYEAWTDLLLMASYKDTKFISGNELLQMERGSLVTSELQLMEKWDWSKTKVRSFLKLLEDDNMIIREADAKKTAITIVNYGVYQEVQTAEKPQEDCKKTAKEPQKDHKETVKELQKDTIKEIKKKKNLKNFKKRESERAPMDDKKQYGEFLTVQLTDDEYNKLIDKHGLDKTSHYIAIVDSSMHINKKDYNGEHYAVIENWIRRDSLKDSKAVTAPEAKPNTKPNRFLNFKQRNWDYEQIEQLERQYINASLGS